MERRKFTREFKLEAVRLIKERGVSYAQAEQDLDVHQVAASRPGEEVCGQSSTHLIGRPQIDVAMDRNLRYRPEER